MKLEIKENIVIPDGLHEGIIIAVEYRTSPYEYTDIVIEKVIGDKSIKIKAGYPTFICTTSKLGKLLTKFGASLVAGQEIDPDKLLIGKKCSFITITDVSERGKFANVIPKSVKPI